MLKHMSVLQVKLSVILICHTPLGGWATLGQLCIYIHMYIDMSVNKITAKQP